MRFGRPVPTLFMRVISSCGYGLWAGPYFFSSSHDDHPDRKMAILIFILLFLMLVMAVYSMVWSVFYKHYKEA